MGSKHERHPHRTMLQAQVDDLSAQQTLGMSMNEDISIEAEETGQLDLERLLVASKRYERAHADSSWLEALLEGPLRAKQVLKIWKRKDEISRQIDGNND